MTAPVALYLHVPFCVALCPYCDFVVVPGAAARGPRNRLAAFVAALRREIELRADALDARLGTERPPLASLYLGGGTPSLLPPDAIAGLVDLVRRRLGLAPDAEVTLEANPGPDERGDPDALRAAGVTRLSLGAQSLDAAELRRLGRRHRPEDVADAVAGARAAGIGSIGLDLLYDVPGQTDASWAATLERALELGVDHLSLYALTLDDPDAEGLTGPDERGARRSGKIRDYPANRREVEGRPGGDLRVPVRRTRSLRCRTPARLRGAHRAMRRVRPGGAPGLLGRDPPAE